MTQKPKSRLVLGSLSATLKASDAVDKLQKQKLDNNAKPKFCYLSDAEAHWDSL